MPSSPRTRCSRADTNELIDYEQGIPHFKGYPGRLVPCDPPEGMSKTTLEG